MGLDMYLSARRNVSNFNFRKGEKETNEKIREALGLSDWDSEDASVDVSLTVVYWRKANHIHRWFVEKVQGGQDDCKEAWVNPDDLVRLRDICTEVLEKRDPSLLPTQSGFFFGPTDVDEWYWNEVEWTRAILTKIVEDPRFKGYEFYYQSSW